MSLLRKTAVGISWVALGEIGLRGIGFIVSIFLARIISPEEFGLFGLIIIFKAVGNSLVDAGLSQSLIRSTDLDDADYNVVFYSNLTLAVIVYLIYYLIAGEIARFYNQEALVSMIRVYGISIIISAFMIIQKTRMIIEMDFKTQTKIEVPSLLISGSAGIIFAMNGFGVWSLVYMELIRVSVLTVRYWFYSKWRPSSAFDIEKLKSHFSFGSLIALSSLINTIFLNIYPAVIGKFYSIDQVGYYTRADTMQKFPVMVMSTSMNKVTFPAFSSLQNNDLRLKKAFKKTVRLLFLIFCPIMIYLMIGAEPIFRILLSDKWLPAVPYFQIFCLVGLLFPLNSYNLNILKVKGKAMLFFNIGLFKKAFVLIGLIVAAQWSVLALIWVQVFTAGTGLIINSHFGGKMIDYGLKQQIFDIGFPLLLSSTIGLVLYVLRHAVFGQVMFNDFLLLIINGVTLFSLYFGTLFLIKSKYLLELIEVVNILLKRKTSKV